MGSDASEAILKELGVINENGEFDFKEVSKYLELTINVRERNDGE